MLQEWTQTNTPSEIKFLFFVTVNVQKRCKANKSMPFSDGRKKKLMEDICRTGTNKVLAKHPNMLSYPQGQKIVFHDFLCEQAWP